MLLLLRKIRHKLLRESKFTSYLLYAIGEIILVMIGILLALQVNNWNQTRIKKELELNYIDLLLRDLKADSLSLASISRDSDASVNSKRILLAYQAGEISRPDSLRTHFLRQAFTGVNRFVPNSGAIEEVQSAGGLTLIKNEELRNQILDLYNAYDKLDKNVGQYYRDQMGFLRQSVYAKANGNLFYSFDEVDDNVLQALVMDADLRNRIINNWAVTFNREVHGLSEQNAHVIKSCRSYLNSHQ